MANQSINQLSFFLGPGGMILMTTGAGGQQILMDPKMGVIAEEEDGIQVLFGF